MTTKAKEMRLDAAQKSAEAAAIVANAHLMPPSQISDSDLFDVENGASDVIGLQRRQQPGIRPICLAGRKGPPNRATVFEDGQQVGFRALY